MKSLNEIVAELRMGDDDGKPAYRIGRSDKVEISMPSGQPIRSYVIEEVHISELADWIEAAAKRERAPVGSAAAMREALELCVKEMCNYCRNEAIARGLELTCVDGCEAYRIAQAALAAPARQCDMGTAEEQLRRFAASIESLKCDSIDIKCAYCALRWAHMPYKAEEGDGK